MPRKQSAIEITLPKDQPDALKPIIDRIVRLCRSVRDTILVGFNSASPRDVGKTYIQHHLHRLLNEQKIATGIVPKAEGYRHAIADLGHEKKDLRTDMGALLFSGEQDDGGTKTLKQMMQLRRIFNHNLKESSGGACTKYHLWLGIYTPSHPFSHKHVLADYLIRNEGAREK